jgi:hypothetical protein
MPALVREVEATVQAGVPGIWRWRTVFRVPDLYAWVIYTAAEPNTFLYDGTAVRSYVADRLVATEPGTTAALRTHARFTAVTNLDALLLPGVAVRPLAAGDLLPDTASGLDVVFADDGSRYRIGLDGASLVVAVEGPVALPPFGAGTLQARFTDFRRLGGRLLSTATTYAFRGQRLATERTLAACPDPRALDAADFQTPDTLPGCPQS